MRLDPVELAVMNNRLAAVAEEMGVVLGRTAFSPNIKERHDFSCALFDGRGELIAQAAHIPVHLGSTPLSVRAAIERLELEPGDVAALNDPFCGGTHLPDLTLVAPIFLDGSDRPFAYAANRAHHADIGGMAPGSMALATEIYQEGLRVPPVRIVRAGTPAPDVIELFLANTRVREEREGDLRAQLAALGVGAERLRALVDSVGRRAVAAAMSALEDYAERLMRATLRALPAGEYRARDFLDDDGFDAGPIPICVAVEIRNGRARADFTGSAAQVRGPVNANYAITLSATFYVMKCLAREEIPANEGLMRPVEVIAPEGSIVNALPPAAVAGGNVETSQRIVDVLLRALAKAAPERIPAASSGSMSNLTVGGYDPTRARHFSYYETIAGGAGAAPDRRGASGIHTHMTNTLNTPIEALEAYYPMRVTEYRIRRGSGGGGRARGGDGLVRELQCLVAASASLLTERRRLRPWGLAGGADGARGNNYLIRGRRRRKLAGKVNLALEPGDRVRIETPGGGGFGSIARRPRRTEPERKSRYPARHAMDPPALPNRGRWPRAQTQDSLRAEATRRLSHMAETQFWVGVHGVLAEGGRVLVLRRSRLMTYKPGHWDLPGGHLALGENLEQCLVREIEEETGIRAEVERLLGLHKTPSQPYVQAIYGCRLGAEAPRVRLRPEEHSEWRWATPEELRGTPDLVPYLEAIVRNGMLHFLER